MSGFGISFATAADALTMSLSGELDILAIPDLESGFDKEWTSSPRRIVVDMTSVTFCDSSCVRTLLKIAALCAQNDVEMSVVGVAANVRRVFEITDTLELLRVRDADDGD